MSDLAGKTLSKVQGMVLDTMRARLASLGRDVDLRLWAERSYRVLIVVTLLYFVAQLVFYAFAVGHHIPPDETTHVGLARHYSKYVLLPENTPESYQYGLVTNVPYLYSFLLGKLIKLNVFGLNDVVFLRLVNVVIGLLTVWVGFLWVRLVSQSRLVRLGSLVVITNIPMFSLLCASVNYDNLVNLLAVVAIYGLSRFLLYGGYTALFWCAGASLAGCLTKVSFVPLAGLFVIVAAVALWRRRDSVVSDFRAYLAELRPGKAALLATTLVFVYLNAMLYVGNIVQYGFYKNLLPPATRILPFEACMQYRIYAQHLIIDLYRSDQITLEDATKLAYSIKDKGDRQITLVLLQQLKEGKGKPFVPIDRFSYGMIWLQGMINSTIGIGAHRMLTKSGYGWWAYVVVLLAALAEFVRKWRWRSDGAVVNSAVFITSAYVLIIMQMVIYQYYLAFRNPQYSLQGRYLFPVIVPIVGLGMRYLLSIGPRGLRWGFFGAVCVLFIWGDLPYFLARAGGQWFAAGW